MMFLAERLARCKLPYAFEFSTTPLRNEAGKMTRRALRNICKARLEAGEHFAVLRRAVAA